MKTFVNCSQKDASIYKTEEPIYTRRNIIQQKKTNKLNNKSKSFGGGGFPHKDHGCWWETNFSPYLLPVKIFVQILSIHEEIKCKVNIYRNWQRETVNMRGCRGEAERGGRG